MKEIDINRLNEFVDPLNTEKDPAILMMSDEKRSNGLTIGWASYGILWQKRTATVYIHKKRYSKEVCDNAEYFAINYMEPEHKDLIKYFGTVSGRNEDKLANSKLEIVYDKAPYFKDARVVIICRIMGKSDFNPNSVDDGVKEWYQKDGVHTQYYGEIIKVLVK